MEKNSYISLLKVYTDENKNDTNFRKKINNKNSGNRKNRKLKIK